MTRVGSTPRPFLPRLLIALLLSAAGLSFAQAPPAVEAAASAPTPQPASAPARRPTVAQPIPGIADIPTWAALNPAQQSLLAPLERDWPKLSATQRSKWLNATPLFSTLTPEEQARLHDRMRDWARLTPEERRDARIGFQVAKQLRADRREARWEAYQALPPEKRQEFLEKATARREAQARQPASPKPPQGAAPKSNIVPAAPKLVSSTPVTGSLIQAKPGASTVLITRPLAVPTHHAAGEAKVVADPSLVDPKTLLPKALKTPPPAATPGS